MMPQRFVQGCVSQAEWFLGHASQAIPSGVEGNMLGKVLSSMTSPHRMFSPNKLRRSASWVSLSFP